MFLFPSRTGARRAEPRADTASRDADVEGAPATVPDDAPIATGDLTGTVLERSTRAPVAGARVYGCTPARERSVPSGRSAVTDDEGRFSLAMTAAGDSHLQVVATGFATAIKPMPTASAEILLDRGLSVSGTVLDDGDAPVVAARVWAHRDGNQAAWPGLHGSLPVGSLAEGGSAETGPDGSFRIEGLHAGSYFVRAAKAGWCFPDWSEPPKAEAGSEGVALRLWPTHTLVVEHRDKTTGEPIRCVQARLSRQPKAGFVYPMPGDVSRGETLLDQAAQGFDAETATTRITFAVVGSRCNTEWDVRQFPLQRLFCVAPGYATFKQEILVKRPGETRILAAMERVRPGATGTVRMEAHFAGSNAPYEGLLQATIDEGTSATRGTSVLRFECGVATTPLELPPGDYKALAGGHGEVGNFWIDAGPRTAFTVPTGAEEMRVRLELRGNPVRLVVRDAEGRAVRGYDLIVNPATGPSGGVKRWDAPSNHAWLQRWREGYTGPDLYLPPGGATVGASLAGVGTASTQVSASGDGSPIAITLTLR